MSRLAFFTDLQLDSTPPRDRKDGGGKSIRFQENEATIAAAMEEAISMGAEGLLFGGDITEEKNPESAVSTAAARLFSKWYRKWGVPGNHDGSVFKVSSSSIEPLAISAGSNFKLYDTVRFDDELRCLFIPYMHRYTHEEIRKMVVGATAHAGPGKIFVVMHYGPEGATVGAANTVLAGDYLPMSIFDGLDVDHVLCGHIHKAQEHVINGIHVHVAGSSLICNIAERLDRKTWGMFDTERREYTSHEIKQPRQWVKMDWQDLSNSMLPGAMPMKWSTGDIVAITGEHPRDVYPKQVIEDAIRTGALPEPFSISYESKPQREERIARAAPINAEDGLREGLRKFVQSEFTRESDEPGQVAPATALAMDAIAESVGSSYCTEIHPTSIRITGFATILKMDYAFTPSEPVLVLGENGTGKSNFMAALYWAQTGELPNGMGFIEAVNRSSDSCIVEVEYAGRSPEREEQQFSVVRSVKISKDGTPKHELSLGHRDPVTGEWDTQSMNDGGIKERQQRLNNLLGGSPAVQRIANFSIQDDSDPFIKAHPKIRKVVIGEVTGQDPIKRAHKRLDDDRREAGRSLEDGKQRLSGVLAVAENAGAQVEALETERVEAQSREAALVAGVPLAAAALTTAQAAERRAAEAVTAREAELAAIPATEPAVAAAKATLAASEQAFAALKTERRNEYNGWDGAALALSAELAALDVPTAEAVELLRAKTSEALDALESARIASTGAATEAAAADARLAGAQANHKAALDRLLVTPAAVIPPAVEPLETAVTEAVAEEVAAGVAHKAAADALSTAREVAAGHNATMAVMRADLSTFDGQDVGNCSRCGQAINSAHIETETVRLKAEIAATEVLIEAIGLPALVAAEQEARITLSSAASKRSAAQQALEAATSAVAAAMNAAIERLAAENAASHTLHCVEVGQANANEAAQVKFHADAHYGTVSAAYADASAAHRTAADAAATSAAKQERLRAAMERMAELVAAGTADKTAYEVKHWELSADLKRATDQHFAADANRKQIQMLIEAARITLTAAQQAASNARVALAQAESKLTAATTEVANLTMRIASLKEQVAAVEQAKIEIAMLTQQAQITSIAVAITEQFRLALIDQSIPLLEDRTNYWLDVLGAGAITARFTTRDGEKDTLDILIDDGKPGRALDIACYSGGQKRRVEMAVKRALNELKRQSVGVTLGFHGYDEPTDGLDDKGKSAFIEMVMNDPCPVQIITSHDDSIIAAFDNSIRLVRGAHDETVMEEA